jgi:hypothetical protein
MKFNIPSKAKYHEKWKSFEEVYEAESKAKALVATEAFLRKIGTAMRRHLRSVRAHVHYIEFHNCPVEVSFSMVKSELERLGYTVHTSNREMTVYFN